MNLKSALHCPNCKGNGYNAFCALNYGVVFETQPVRFEAGRVVRIRKQEFRVGFHHLGSKKSSQYQEKGLG